MKNNIEPSRGKCYIVQEPMKTDGRTGETVPVMDFRKVLEYGDPVVCLGSGSRVSLSTAPMVRQLTEVLKGFSDEDYLVAVGDPTAMSIAAAICLLNNTGRMKMLKWDKQFKQYIKVEVDIYPYRKEN